MNPLLPATIIVAWLIGLYIAWAFVHGAQILRRQEVAGLIAAEQEASVDETAPVAFIAPEPSTLPKAA
ncbi:hypothetical protein Achl_4374 (plasmid) [Pseudarthrobacter chlorophenolicus A6]|uniref:Uncharacterized protein n=1 Tax=Pseudarthrobacter chlorophenolicus (strain ATCC 700700 / DSM 12829 / CIP 107037 / JCM 12360 / KCTC 9906 / NCIMB 13794 / A6) TaxID=452863 RepID=B8HIS8_PSECP|nr:hypothetical protein [Pseudarthrobacter chlorophenolicus]ACL42325.1 hypothetical protein Achl_4374 [Pseudarthrobacter chlorophenolicus A6]SDQ16520.1 hypothetical protein SAMN04489738_0431 [Pseudarthrobacter chlorophenolicus]